MTTSPGHRRDIQGLRALAVAMVLAFHAGLPLPGGFVGVDVFFVVSGFLITSLIRDEVARTGRLDLGRFWARRARRLLPAAAATLLAVVVATVVWLPVTRWRAIAGDVVAASTYVVNWRLADRSVDYLAQDAAAGPVQHFWSLAVEEQLYVLWPLLVVAGLAWARRRPAAARAPAPSGLAARTTLTGLAVALAVASFAWSVALTSRDPGRAYLVTTTRVWELAVGALLALQAHRVARLDPRLLRVAGWAGLAAIVVSALVVTTSTPFPGVVALAPVLGTALVLAAGLTGPGLPVLGLAAWQPVGAASYSLYLWHWPAVVVVTAVAHGTPGTAALLAAVAVSFVPAMACHRLIERPLHLGPRLRRSVRLSAALGLACTLVGVVAAAGLARAVPAAPAGASASGAQVLRDGSWAGPDPATDLDRLVPALADATSDVAELYRGGCHQSTRGVEATACTFGDPQGVVVALVGDSHAGQWQPPLAAIAQDEGWRLDTYTKGSCALTSARTWLSTLDGPYDECARWNEAVLDRLLADPPDVVVTSNDAIEVAADDGGRLSGAAGDGAAVSGLVATWQRLVQAGVRVVVIGDTPWVGIDVPECVATHRSSWAQSCTVDAAQALRRSGLAQQEAAALQADVPVLDLTAMVCPDEVCPAVVGGVLVWRDGSHLTATYARGLAPELRAWLVPLVTGT